MQRRSVCALRAPFHYGGRARGIILVLAAVLQVALVPGGPAAAQWAPQTKCDSLGGYELENCLGKELTEADTKLNAAYQQALSAIAADDTPAGPKAAWRENMVAAQRAWLAYRDANCKFDLIGAEWHFGSGTTSAQQECVLALTQARTAELIARTPQGK